MDFRQIIKEVGRGKNHARDLDREQSLALYREILSGDVPDLQLGALLIAFRIKGEAEEEMLGFYQAMEERVMRLEAPADRPLPVVIPIFANLLYSQRDGKLAWMRLMPALVLIGIGLMCVNIAELRQGLPDFSGWRYGSGIALASVSVVCWAWYALRNARWLRENPQKPPLMWATAQALVTLPVSLVGYVAACLWLHLQTPDFALPFGPRPTVFIGLMITIAVLCSWVGALCWNVASQRLPTVILGPLIVFETLAGLLYTFLLRQEMPPMLTLSGITLLVIGVVIAVRSKPQKPAVVPVSEA